MGDATDSHAKRREHFDEVVCRGLAFHVGSEGEDNLGGIFEGDTIDELLDAELIRADMIERSEASAESVIEAVECACAFERENVGGILDHADLFAVPGGVLTDFAKVIDGEETAFRAGMNGLRCARYSRCQ